MKNYKLTIDGKRSVELEAEAIANLDIQAQPDGSYHLIDNANSYKIQVLSINRGQKTLELSVNGKSFNVAIEDQYDLLVKKLGLEVVNNQKINDILAPMPGLVLDISVEVGQTIEKGTPLLILEAMKMENVIKAGGEGVVKEILVEKGAAVEKGALLIKLD